MQIRLLVFLLCLGSGSTVAAQNWARDMFDHASHDFGVVARGAKVQHRFTLENIYLEDVHIKSVHSSCHCTIPEFTKETLQTYETAEIVATVDTRTFLGRKDATIRVVFDKPFAAEVQLHVHCYIRSDVVVEPGDVQFGTVTQGTPVRKKLSVTYAGRADWKIVDVQTTQPYLQAKVLEVNRGFGRVGYDLWVDLTKDAPQGYLKDFVMLITNDRNAEAVRVPVAVEGLVIGTISAQPSPLPLGILQTGQTVTRNLVVHGKRPFRIESVTSVDGRFQFRVPSESRPVQLVAVTFAAGDTPGQVTGAIQIRTDLEGGEALEVKVDGMVIGKDDVPTRESNRSTPAESKQQEGWKPVVP